MNISPAVNDMLDEAALTTLRQDLAAAFRLCHRFGWSESVGNHFSAAVSANGRKFLLNPRWQHFATVKASDLLLLDADDPDVMHRPNAPDPSAWTVHGTLHRMLPEARVILHCHSPYAVALSCLKDPTLLPLDNNTARFFGRIGYDLDFGGIADAAEEGERLAEMIRGKAVLVMGNHGVSVAGETVADAALYLSLADTIMGEDWVMPSTFRFGASGLLDDINAVLSGERSTAAASGY